MKFALPLFFATASVALADPSKAFRGQRRLDTDVAQAIADAKDDIKALIAKDPELAAGFVRLAFHDCVGGCNGCVDLNNGDNNGLESRIDTLAEIVENYASSLSRADIWALAGFAASEAAQLGGKEVVLFPMDWYGRKDCSSLDGKSDPEGPANEFPSPNLSTPDLLDFMLKTFCFDDEETVAIMGAHTLGKAVRENSGFDGEGGWVSQDTVLDNKYYVQLLNANWKQIFIDNTDLPDIPNRWMWTKGGAGGSSDNKFMLDSDVALRADFTDFLKPSGEVTCPLKKSPSGCPFAAIAGFSEEYAKDNLLWLTDFQKAYAKMLTTGYDTSDGCDNPPCRLGALTRGLPSCGD